LSGKDQIEKAMKRKDAEIQELRSRMGTVAAWAESLRNLHLPYISGKMDTSVSTGEQKVTSLCNQIKQNLWCSECSTRWPCKALDDLQQLRYFVQDRMDEDDEKEFKTRIRNMKPRDKPGQLDMHI
jgi:hypothetical protein